MDAIVEKLNRKKRRLWDASGRGAKTARDLINSLYGATFDGRVVYSALVFDIGEVARMLGREMDARYWARLTLEPVRYADRPVEDIFPELVAASADTLRQFIDGVKLPEMAVQEFLAGTTLLKGAAYKSERNNAEHRPRQLCAFLLPGAGSDDDPLDRQTQAQAVEQSDVSLACIGPSLDLRQRRGRVELLRVFLRRVLRGGGAGDRDDADLAVTISRCP
jgi:hypothetical protein